MIIRTLVILFCFQAAILFAQPVPRNVSIPQKSKACTPAEEKWWNEVRDKGSEVLSLVNQLNEARRYRGNIKKVTTQLEERRKELIALIETGQGKNYTVPVDDTRLMILYTPKPDYTEEARRQKESGTVDADVEFGADGQVSKARIVRGLKYGLDEKALDVINNIVFIPAVADGHFKTTTSKIKATFTTF